MTILHRNGKTYSGAGVIVIEKYTKSNGDRVPCIILAKPKWSKLYMDFGGSYEKDHRGLRITASSELREESRNLINLSPLKLIKYVDIPAGMHLYRSYVVRIDGIDSNCFKHNAQLLDNRKNVPKSWRETEDIKHIPITKSNIAQIRRGNTKLKDVNNNDIYLHDRAKGVILRNFATIQKMINSNPLARYKDMCIYKSTGWKNKTYTFNIK